MSPARRASRASQGTDEVLLLDALVQTSFLVTAALNRVAAAHDLSLTQLRVLAILRDRTVRMSDLAEYLGLDRSTISGLVERAEQRGLVRRTPSPVDGRSVEVGLTAEGVALGTVGAADVADALRGNLDGLTRTERDRLAALLERLRPAR